MVDQGGREIHMLCPILACTSIVAKAEKNFIKAVEQGQGGREGGFKYEQL